MLKDDDNLGEMSAEAQGRRDFLKKAGKFAAVTPPAVTLLFSTSLEANALALSGGAAGPKPTKRQMKMKRRMERRRKKIRMNRSKWRRRFAKRMKKAA
jgi:hypothetical protein